MGELRKPDLAFRLLDHERGMRRAGDRRPRLPGESAEQDRDGDRVRAVEPGGRLVCEEKRWLDDDRPRDRDTRPLPLREPCNTLGRALTEPDRLERLQRRDAPSVEAAQGEDE